MLNSHMAIAKEVPDHRAKKEALQRKLASFSSNKAKYATGRKIAKERSKENGV